MTLPQRYHMRVAVTQRAQLNSSSLITPPQILIEPIMQPASLWGPEADLQRQQGPRCHGNLRRIHGKQLGAEPSDPALPPTTGRTVLCTQQRVGVTHVCEKIHSRDTRIQRYKTSVCLPRSIDSACPYFLSAIPLPCWFHHHIPRQKRSSTKANLGSAGTPGFWPELTWVTVSPQRLLGLPSGGLMVTAHM